VIESDYHNHVNLTREEEQVQGREGEQGDGEYHLAINPSHPDAPLSEGLPTVSQARWSRSTNSRGAAASPAREQP
jgi:hypothetical protein